MTSTDARSKIIRVGDTVHKVGATTMYKVKGFDNGRVVLRKSMVVSGENIIKE